MLITGILLATCLTILLGVPIAGALAMVAASRAGVARRRRRCIKLGLLGAAMPMRAAFGLVARQVRGI